MTFNEAAVLYRNMMSSPFMSGVAFVTDRPREITFIQDTKSATAFLREMIEAMELEMSQHEQREK